MHPGHALQKTYEKIFNKRASALIAKIISKGLLPSDLPEFIEKSLQMPDSGGGERKVTVRFYFSSLLHGQLHGFRKGEINFYAPLFDPWGSWGGAVFRVKSDKGDFLSCHLDHLMLPEQSGCFVALPSLLRAAEEFVDSIAPHPAMSPDNISRFFAMLRNESGGCAVQTLRHSSSFAGCGRYSETRSQIFFCPDLEMFLSSQGVRANSYYAEGRGRRDATPFDTYAAFLPLIFSDNMEALVASDVVKEVLPGEPPEDIDLEEILKAAAMLRHADLQRDCRETLAAYAAPVSDLKRLDNGFAAAFEDPSRLLRVRRDLLSLFLYAAQRGEETLTLTEQKKMTTPEGEDILLCWKISGTVAAGIGGLRLDFSLLDRAALRAYESLTSLLGSPARLQMEGLSGDWTDTVDADVLLEHPLVSKPGAFRKTSKGEYIPWMNNSQVTDALSVVTRLAGPRLLADLVERDNDFLHRLSTLVGNRCREAAKAIPDRKPKDVTAAAGDVAPARYKAFISTLHEKIHQAAVLKGTNRTHSWSEAVNIGDAGTVELSATMAYRGELSTHVMYRPSGLKAATLKMSVSTQELWLDPSLGLFAKNFDAIEKTVFAHVNSIIEKLKSERCEFDVYESIGNALRDAFPMDILELALEENVSSPSL